MATSRKPPKAKPTAKPAKKAAAKPASKRGNAKKSKRCAPKSKPAKVMEPVQEITLSELTDTLGRPTSYKPEYADIAKTMCKQGASDNDLAGEFGVTTRTIWNWGAKYKDFFLALREGKDAWDDKIERSLAQRAAGYSYSAEKIFSYQGEIVRAETTEHVPPDPGAAKMWLNNRRPDQWRDKVTQEITGKDGGAIQIDGTTNDMEVARRVAFALGRALTKQERVEDAQIIDAT